MKTPRHLAALGRLSVAIGALAIGNLAGCASTMIQQGEAEVKARFLRPLEAPRITILKVDFAPVCCRIQHLYPADEIREWSRKFR